MHMHSLQDQRFQAFACERDFNSLHHSNNKKSTNYLRSYLIENLGLKMALILSILKIMVVNNFDKYYWSRSASYVFSPFIDIFYIFFPSIRSTAKIFSVWIGFWKKGFSFDTFVFGCYYASIGIDLQAISLTNSYC